ncbi:hypothetical protein PHAVU_003G221300 [Phaseolus vulgaris]
MDYDDNDFQSQNLHITGEGSTKFPPVLRPYALPKFDLDESLQGHLRFDSLVETEVFLGIESNEDNQWIDAYSRGSSGIEFGSTAAESCSISRHNNVWSEATSSESVEMLLKSVGQEEFIPRETDIQESNAFDELACLAKQMEPGPNPNNRNEYKDGVTDLQPPCFIHENLAGLKEAEREQSQAVVSQGELSIDGSLSTLQPHDILGNVDLPVARGFSFTDDKSDDANQGKVEIVADGSLEEKTQEESAASGAKNSITVTSITNISSTCEVLKIQNVQNHVVDMGHEEQSSLQMQTNQQYLDSFAIIKDSDVDIQTSNLNAVGGEEHDSDKPLCSIPMEEALESGNVVESLETSERSLGGSLGMVYDGISDLQNTGRCHEDASFRDLSRSNAKEDTVVDNPSAVYTSDSRIVAIKDDSSSEGQIIGVSKSENSTCPSFQKNEGTVETTYSECSDSKENELVNIGNQMDTELLFSKSEASIFAVGDNNTSTINRGNNDIKPGSSASLGALDSTTSCILVEATQVCENDESDKQGDHGNFCQDISAIDLANKKATSDSSVKHYNVDQPHHLDSVVSSSSLSTGNMETKSTTATISDDEPVNNSDSQYILENISSTSCEIADVTPPSRVVSTLGVTDHFEVPGVILVGSASIDEKENVEATLANEEEATLANEASARGTLANEASAEAALANEEEEATLANEASAEATLANEASAEATLANEARAEATLANEASSEATVTNEASAEAKICIEVSSEGKRANEASSEAKIAHDASSALPVGSSEQETAPCPVTGTEKLHFSDTSRQPLYETINSSVITASGKMGKPQETPSDKVDQECAKEVGVTLVLREPIEKLGDEVAVSFTKDDKEAVQEFHDKSSSTISGEDLSANEGSKSSLPDSCTKLHETGGSPANNADNACGASVTFGSQPETEKDVNQVKASAHLNPSISECINKDALNMSTNHDPKGNDASKEERSLAPVANLSKKNVSGKTTKGTNSGKRQRAAANKASMVGEESPLASVVGTPKTKVAGNISLGSPQISDGVMAHTVSQGTPERKPRRSSNKTAGKETSRKGNKGKSPGRHSERGDRSTSVSLNPSPGFQVMQLNEPFMDIQQIQLRAQIFVYGALIQGMVPDEAYMISAFGGPDGGRSIWQNAWFSCMERQHGKTHPMNPETPLQLRSGQRTTDVAVKQNALQGISSPLGVASNKATPTIANPLIPLSSPLWSLQTPSCDSLQSALARGSVVDYSQALNSSHYQTPPLRNFLGHNTSWLSQAPLRGSWTPIPASDNNSSHISALPLTATVQFNSVKGSPVPPSIKNVPPGLPASSAVVQSVFIATTPLHDTNNVMVLNAQHSSDPKPKKRKKSMVSEDLGLKPIHLQSQLVPTPVVNSHISTAVATTPAGSVPITTVEKSVVSVTPLSLADHLKSDWNVKMRILSDESLAKVKEARENAEDASVLSAAAVNHSLEIWKQLDKQKNSGLVSDIEAKLASAAVAVAAAAAVAKAAAAAANVASNAALHAKLMADEALVSSGYESSCQISCSEGMSNLGKATPASILKGTIGTNTSSSIIGAAKEVARKRVEAASAARKRAENMDAIVKAAELAAEAVSQAGKIVTMGDPLALNDLVEAGPEGCWNAAREFSQQVGLLKDMNNGLVSAENIGDRPETSLIRDRDISFDEMGKKTAAHEKSPFHTVRSEISQDHMKCIDGNSSINIYEKSSKGPTLVNPIDVPPESEIEIQAASTAGNRPEDVEEDNIKEGSPVEVFKDGEGFKAAWYKAKVLSVKDGKAYVSYDLPVDDEGAGPLKEWVSLESDEDKPPRIRIASNITGLRNEGTRKRQRAAMVDYTWSVGDRVDAWVEDSWQEGVITDQNKKDKTITVHFPVSGKTSLFRAWHLRQSFIWKDGKWIEAPKVGAKDSFTHEGDTPHEKRLKLGSPAVEVKGKDRIPKGTNAVESANPGELRLLDLTENDKVFNIGKNIKHQNKSDAHRMLRTGLAKEGSRVNFGVPKPGKKRKFMEVSKHYVADGTSKINDRNDSVKLSNFLVSQGTGGSRVLKNTSKNDTKEKLGAGSRPAIKSGKLQSVSGRVIPPKENTLTNSRTKDVTSRAERIKDSSSQFKNVSQSENQVERASYSGNIGAGVGPILYSSLESLTDSHPTKKTSTSRASKGKLAPAGGGRLAKIDEEKSFNGNPVKSTSDISEPRRSNRRIQPTSRLLEGLQSSLIISKIPSASVSHEKGHKNQNRNTSRG